MSSAEGVFSIHMVTRRVSSKTNSIALLSLKVGAEHQATPALRVRIGNFDTGTARRPWHVLIVSAAAVDGQMHRRLVERQNGESRKGSESAGPAQK